MSLLSCSVSASDTRLTSTHTHTHTFLTLFLPPLQSSNQIQIKELPACSFCYCCMQDAACVQGSSADSSRPCSHNGHLMAKAKEKIQCPSDVSLPLLQKPLASCHASMGSFYLNPMSYPCPNCPAA